MAFRLPPIGLDILALTAGLVSSGLVQDSTLRSTSADAIRQTSASRQFSGDDARRVDELKKTIEQLSSSGKFTEAIEPAKRLHEFCLKAVGIDHWQTADARRAIEDLEKITALPEEGRKALSSAHQLSNEATAAMQRARYAESERAWRSLLDIDRRWLGEDHPLTAQTYNSIGESLIYQGKHAEAELPFRRALAIRLASLGENHPLTAESYNNVASYLNGQGNYREAEPLHRKALDIWLATLGENHPDTASGYNNLAYILNEQGRSTEAEALFRQALAIRLATRGEKHPDTAFGYNNVAYSLQAQGRSAEAEPLFRKALAIWLATRGEKHPLTATSYNNVAYSLQEQGRHAEAEPLHRRALAIRLLTLGEDHPQTASTYHHLGMLLQTQGRYAEAEPLHRTGLAIWLVTLGEKHPDTAASYNNLATSLDDQGKPADAEPLYRKARAILIASLGENHPLVARSHCNLAHDLQEQGRHAEAEPLYRQALSIQLKALGESHPDTAGSYNDLARSLEAQRNFAEAEPLHRKALAIRLATLGENHYHTARNYSDLAGNLDVQGKLDQAVRSWTSAADIYLRAHRARSATGLERALTAGYSPLVPLAAALARQGQSHAAWTRWETSLARGLLDDLSARQLRPLTDEEWRRETDLAGRLQQLDEQIARLVGKSRHTLADDQQLDEFRNRQNTLRGRWVELQNQLEAQYGLYAGKPAELGEIQRALPGDTALVGWLDVKNDHWACVVRRTGNPAWIKIPGSGTGGAWTTDDDRRVERLRTVLFSHQPAWRDLAAVLAKQRLEPLRPWLRGAAHLVVLPSQALAGIPIEILVATQDDPTPRLVVSHAPSGSMWARLRTPRSQGGAPPRLLALGDPEFPKPARAGPAPTPPVQGVAILTTEPHGNADLFGIKPGDVLLEYNNQALRTIKDLAVVPSGDKPRRVPVKLWRDGEVRTITVAAGPLGIRSDPDRSTAQLVLAQRAAAEVLGSGSLGENLIPLPGTGREVRAIAALFPSDLVTTLLGPDATESNLQRSAQAGELKGYRFIHLATHGKTNPSVALSSALFLAAEPERPAASSADPAASGWIPDGRVTAEQIVRTWELDADLVVLSACESGLGRYAGGEGYLGFAQALFVKGARSLLLSQWKVDDQATALLMTRFYQNLLGRRPGLANPLPKAEALHEAKAWLRDLTAEEVGLALDALERGPERPLVTGSLSGTPTRPPSPYSRPAGVQPFAHPYFWAGFILIGDPN
jgi:CHAT domain-containing protein/tetratricopeptide (TPR) repeat protein